MVQNGQTKKTLKLTAVGDGAVGKTSLLIAYKEKQFNEEYVPTVFDNYASVINVDDIEYNMALWDTAGQEDYERLRPLTYPQTTCFLLCYSIAQKASYDNIITKWAPEIKHHAPNAAILLIGTKSDLRQEDDPSTILIPSKDGNKMAKRIKALGYYECSAKNMTGIDEIFETAVRASARKQTNNRQLTCTIL